MKDFFPVMNFYPHILDDLKHPLGKRKKKKLLSEKFTMAFPKIKMIGIKASVITKYSFVTLLILSQFFSILLLLNSRLQFLL